MVAEIALNVNSLMKLYAGGCREMDEFPNRIPWTVYLMHMLSWDLCWIGMHLVPGIGRHKATLSCMSTGKILGKFQIMDTIDEQPSQYILTSKPITMDSATTEAHRAPGLDLGLCETFPEFQEQLPMSLRAAQGYANLSSKQIFTKIAEVEADVTGPFTHRFEIDSLPFSLHNQKGISLTLNSNQLQGGGSITIAHCKDFILTASGTSALAHGDKFFLKIHNCHNFIIRGLQTTGGRHTLLVTDSQLFRVSQLQVEKGNGYGIIIFNSSNFSLEHCRIEGNLAGIMVVGRSQNGNISNCNIGNLRGFCNCDAGVHLCATSRAITPEDLPENCHEPLSIEQKTWRPRTIVIRNTTCSDCRAQGIYLEGAVNCLMQNNILLNNNKEGICFDWGSCYNLFIENTVTLNGERRTLSKEEIMVDFISQYPLLEDGSSSMKLPGISLDNGCMNLVASNKISSNYGGGIKMIRSAMLNAIRTNTLVANTIGNNRFLPPFHGISVLSVGAGSKEFTDGKKSLLDFLPSVANLITDNILQEDGLALFLDKRSQKNTVQGNTISRNPACTGSKRGLKKIPAFLRRGAWRCRHIIGK